MFLVPRTGDAIKREFIDTIKTIPDSFKNFIKTNTIGDLKFAPDFSIFHVRSNTLSSGFQASYKGEGCDTEATDWCVIE